MDSPKLAPLALSLMCAELALASWETIWHRTALMATGACTVAEYERMVGEKMHAVQQASLALLSGAAPEAVLRPFHAPAVANAKRLKEGVSG